MLELRALHPEDEPAAMAAHAELAAEGFIFLLDLDRAGSFADYLGLLEQQRAGRDPDRVRASFLVAEVAGRLVGRTSIRHTLDAFLAEQGGHVGFAVRPAQRRRGYATAILRGSLDVLAADGLASALVTCDDDNAASAATIERCGGSLTDRITVDGEVVRRYDVPTAWRDGWTSTAS